MSIITLTKQGITNSQDPTGQNRQDGLPHLVGNGAIEKYFETAKEGEKRLRLLMYYFDCFYSNQPTGDHAFDNAIDLNVQCAAVLRALDQVNE